MTEQRIGVIAGLAGVSVDTATEIIDPDYTYWSQRGDSTREEHMAFLAGPDADIAEWVRSIASDTSGTQAEIRAEDTWSTR